MTQGEGIIQPSPWLRPATWYDRRPGKREGPPPTLRFDHSCQVLAQNRPDDYSRHNTLRSPLPQESLPGALSRWGFWRTDLRINTNQATGPFGWALVMWWILSKPLQPGKMAPTRRNQEGTRHEPCLLAPHGCCRSRGRRTPTACILRRRDNGLLRKARPGRSMARTLRLWQVRLRRIGLRWGRRCTRARRLRSFPGVGRDALHLGGGIRREGRVLAAPVAAIPPEGLRCFRTPRRPKANPRKRSPGRLGRFRRMPAPSRPADELTLPRCASWRRENHERRER